MATITVQEYLEARAPADYLTEPKLAEMKTQAELEVGDNYCSEDIHNKVVALLVCHWIALSKRGDGTNQGGAGGTLISEKEGQLARSFGNAYSITNEAYLSQTSWGLEIIGLQKSCFVMPRNRFVS